MPAVPTYPEGMDHTASPAHEQPGHEQEDEQDDLLSALEVIEAQPLATRAVAYEGLHDALARRLESGPAGIAAHP
jgi:hypothetical protein